MDRRMNPVTRRKRIERGGASAILAPVIVWYLQTLGVFPQMSQEVALSVSAAFGAVLAWVSVCFDELRYLMMEWFRARINRDRRK